MSEPHIAFLFVYRVNKDIQENDIRHLLDCTNIKVLNICVGSHELAKCKSFKIVICHHDVDKVLSLFLWRGGVRCRRFYSKH